MNSITGDVRAALELFGNVRPDRAHVLGGYVADCPVHLPQRVVALRLTPDGRIHGCEEGCEPEAILEAAEVRRPLLGAPPQDESHPSEPRAQRGPAGPEPPPVDEENPGRTRRPSEDDPEPTGANHRPIVPVPAEEFLAEPCAPIEWLITPLVPARQVTVVLAAPNVGKTQWALDCAAQVAKSGKRALLIEAEGGKAGLQRRLRRAIAAVGGVSPGSIQVLWTTALHLLDKRHEELITTWAKGFDLVVLDSLAALIAGIDENDSKEMSRVAEALARIAENAGVAVLAVHHTTKDSWAVGETPSLRHLRGHSVLAARVDAALALVPADAPAGHIAFEIHCVKQRDEEKARPRRVTICMTGDAATVTVDAEETARISSARRGGAYAIKELVFERIPYEGGVSKNWLANVSGKRDVDVRKAVDLLEDEGRIKKLGPGKYVRVPPGPPGGPPEAPEAHPHLRGFPPL